MPASPVLPFEKVNPLATLRQLTDSKPDSIARFRHDVEAASTADLLTMNARWFGVPTGMPETVAMLWLINSRLTKLGIAPAWRKIPFIHVKPPGPMPHAKHMFRPLGDSLRRSLIRRWIDLEWLATVVPDGHVPKRSSWQAAFRSDPAAAEVAWARINAVRSSGGGKVGAETPHKVVYALDLPDLLTVGLTGLINRDQGERLKNARKRVETRIRPKMEALTTRQLHPLTREEVERRLIACEAIELTPGHLADAAIVFRWITGEKISRQSMFAMRKKIAEQCKLTTRAWGS